MFKVNNKNTGTRCEICSKLTTKTPKRRQCRFWCSTPCSSASIVNFEQVNAAWDQYCDRSPVPNEDRKESSTFDASDG